MGMEEEIDNDLHEGGCFCGRLRYRISGEPQSSDICHCVSCRRATGAQSVAWLTVSIEDFSFVSGEHMEYRSSPEVVRTFCGKCGTSLTYQHEGDKVDVTTASLDRPEDFPPACHIWMEDKIGWESVHDGLPRFQRGNSAD